jgi:hypothetical protein
MLNDLTPEQRQEWFRFISQPIPHFHVVGSNYLVHTTQLYGYPYQITRFVIFPNGKLNAYYHGKIETIRCDTPRIALTVARNIAKRINYKWEST